MPLSSSARWRRTLPIAKRWQRSTASSAIGFDPTRRPQGSEVVGAVSFVGAPVTIAALAAIVALVLVVRREQTLLIGWLAALMGGGLLDWGLKASFRRPRPEEAGQFLHGHSWSFPSGHTMGSVVAFVVSLFVTSWRRRFVIGLGATLLVLAIGLSRLYLGVHHFTDVIGGLAAGAVWLSACISGVETSRRRKAIAGSAVTALTYAQSESTTDESLAVDPIDRSAGTHLRQQHWLRWGGALLAISGVAIGVALVMMVKSIDLADELLIAVVVVYVVALVAWIAAVRQEDRRRAKRPDSTEP